MRSAVILVLISISVLAANLAHAQHASIPAPVIPEGFGVNIHFTDPMPGEMERLAESGLRWVRMDVTWDATEKER
jgi:hypothetical protein